MKKAFSLLMACALLLPNGLLAQENINLYSWRVHATYHKVTDLQLFENQVYCASANGFFALDKGDFSLKSLSKQDGYGDSKVASLAASGSTLFIGYQTGTLDIETADELISNQVLKNSSFPEKQIYHISKNANTLYLSSDFGVAEYDLAINKYVAEYKGLNDGANCKVFASALANDSLFLATEIGILGNSLSASVNRSDFHTWRLVYSSSQCEDIAAINDKIFFAENGTTSLYAYQAGVLSSYTFPSAFPYCRLSASDTELYVCHSQKVFVMNEALSPLMELASSDKLVKPFDCEKDSDGSYWVADAATGLVHCKSGSYTCYFPSGPYSEDVFRLETIGENVFLSPGGFYEGDGFGKSSGFSLFTEGMWKNYTSELNYIGATVILPIEDWSTAAYNAATQKYYLGAFGDGFFEFVPETGVLTYLEGPTKISDIEIDQDGLVWCTNYGTSTALFYWESGSWHPVTVPLSSAQRCAQLLIDGEGNKWMRAAPEESSGIVVYNEETAEVKYLSKTPTQGGMPSSTVYDMALDKNGTMWVGTDKGICRFDVPTLVLEEEVVDASLPVYENRPLLDGTQIFSICVDGGNRKWLGTDNGLWLVNEDGSQIIAHFNENNSPLLSDNVFDIAIQPSSGEVFIASEGGLQSFRSDATEGRDDNSAALIFPNPVRPEFDSSVAVSGLTYNCDVRFTDASGKLAFKTTANGGTASWDLKDLNGKRVPSGIYMVFTSDKQGKETFVGKILIM